MKRLITFILAALMLFSVPVFSFADDEVAGKYYPKYDPYHVNDTDVMESDWDLTEYIYKETLAVDQQKIIENAYIELSNAIDRKYGQMSVYWAKSKIMPFDVIIKLRDFSKVDGYSFLEYGDDRWEEMEHDIDRKNEIVKITVKENGPVAICYTQGGTSTILEKIIEQKTVYNSVTGKIEYIEGTKAAGIPTRIHKLEDVFVVPVDKSSETLIKIDWNMLNKAYSEVADETPAGMTARYMFWLQEEKTNDIEFTMEDIKVGDKVVCKLFDGSWHEQKVTIVEDGTIKISLQNSGAVAIFTELSDEVF